MAIIRPDSAPEYVGAVISLRTRIDSLFEADHFMALVWTGTEAKEISYGGRQWMAAPNGRPQSYAEMDATPDTLAAYKRWASLRRQTFDTTDMIRDAERLQVGAFVRVIRGRKVPKGSAGKVVKMGQGTYGHWALVKPENADTFIINAENLEVVPNLEWL